MYDVFAIYSEPADRADFDHHYTEVHVTKVLALPRLTDFTWGRVEGGGAGDGSGPYVIARMTFANADDAAEAMASDAGREAVADLASFAAAGVVVHNVPRETTSSASA